MKRREWDTVKHVVVSIFQSSSYRTVSIPKKEVNSSFDRHDISFIISFFFIVFSSIVL